MSFGNTVKDGSGTAYWLLVDSDGRLVLAGAAAHDAAAAGNPVQVGGVYRSTNPAVANGDVASLLIDALGRLRVNEDWTASLQVDEAADDSDKEISVPASREWEIQSIWVEYTSTADAGDRQVVIEIQDDSDDVIGRFIAPVTQAASLTYEYLFAAGAETVTSLRDSTYVCVPIAPLVLPAGYDIRIWDNNAVAAAADDMIVQMMVKERPV